MTNSARRFKKVPIFLAGIAILLSLQSGTSIAKDAKKSAFITDFLGQMDRVKGQIVSLEGTIPDNKFTWRPGEGVRSISEVYLHIADANYLLLSFAGAKTPVSLKELMDQKTRESSTTDKAKIAEALKASFQWTNDVVSKYADADLEKKVEAFGMKMTVRNLLLTLLSHNHEHLGQSIAYARTNGVVPPWTTEMQAQLNKQKEASKK